MRLDTFLYENGYYVSRNKASEGICRGEVYGKRDLTPNFSQEKEGPRRDFGDRRDRRRTRGNRNNNR